MAKQQFKAQADICKKSLDALHKAIEEVIAPVTEEDADLFAMFGD